jgi:hypothetical protein
MTKLPVELKLFRRASVVFTKNHQENPKDRQAKARKRQATKA